ncbi:hypothetical protein LEMLEM_LOCUS3009 [Lemmus lemmus]
MSVNSKRFFCPTITTLTNPTRTLACSWPSVRTGGPRKGTECRLP